MNYFNAPSQTVEVEPERESAELASLRDGFRQLVDACAPKLGEQEITVPTGFAYEHFALSAESGPTDLGLSRF